MHPISKRLAALALFVGTVTANVSHADTVTSFDIEGATADAGAYLVTGTVTVDTTQGLFTAANIAFTGPGLNSTGHDLFSFSGSPPQVITNQSNSVYGFGVLSAEPGVPFNQADVLSVILNTKSLLGYGGGAICTRALVGSSNCGASSGLDNGLYNFDSGKLVAASIQAPEMSSTSAAGSITLLLGIIAVMRGRRRA